MTEGIQLTLEKGLKLLIYVRDCNPFRMGRVPEMLADADVHGLMHGKPLGIDELARHDPLGPS